MQNSDIKNSLMNGLEKVINRSVKRNRWNYRLSVPGYYIAKDAMCHLLPLYFSDDDTAQAALVVNRKESGSYTGDTILNLRDAYINARLISSQENNSWLSVG